MSLNAAFGFVTACSYNKNMTTTMTVVEINVAMRRVQSCNKWQHMAHWLAGWLLAAKATARTNVAITKQWQWQ